MKLQRRKFWCFVVIGVILVVAAALTFSSWLLNMRTLASSEKETIYTTGALVEMSYEDLLAHSSLVASGTIEKEESFEILPVNGGEAVVFTDYTFSIDQVLRGSSTADSVTVRVQGGETDDLISIVEMSPTFTDGESVVLFLYQPGLGGYCNTEGDYYYISGVSQGVFPLDGEHTDIQTAAELPHSAEELCTQITADSAEIPVDENASANATLEELDRGLESGKYTQEEYDYYQEQFHTYATILK